MNKKYLIIIGACFIACSFICFVINLIIDIVLDRTGTSYSRTAEMTEFYFCLKENEKQNLYRQIDSISISEISGNLGLCGTLITEEERDASVSIYVYQEPIQKLIENLPDESALPPGYFFIPLDDSKIIHGEYSAEVLFARRTIASAKLQVNK